MKIVNFVKFCWIVWKGLEEFEAFRNYEGDGHKSYKLELKQIDQKIKNAKKRRQAPKKAHLFLSMFYEAMGSKGLEQKEELITLFCLLFHWWDTIDVSEEEE